MKLDNNFRLAQSRIHESNGHWRKDFHPRGSRRESVVVQLFSLVTDSTSYYKRSIMKTAPKALHASLLIMFIYTTGLAMSGLYLKWYPVHLADPTLGLVFIALGVGGVAASVFLCMRKNWARIVCSFLCVAGILPLSIHGGIGWAEGHIKETDCFAPLLLSVALSSALVLLCLPSVECYFRQSTELSDTRKEKRQVATFTAIVSGGCLIGLAVLMIVNNHRFESMMIGFIASMLGGVGIFIGSLVRLLSVKVE